MALIYITGITGSGKSTVREELSKRGYKAFDIDDIALFYNNETGVPIRRHVAAQERTPDWRAHHTWKASREAIEKLRDDARNEPIFLCGVVANDVDDFWDLFSKVFALSVNEDVLKHRITTRTSSDAGKNAHEFDALLKWQKTAEDDYQKLGAIIIDATRPLDVVVDDILAQVKNN